MFSDYFYLGKITKKFGLKGELVVFLDTDEPQKYHAMESVFLDIEGEPIPFSIESIKVKNNNQLILLFHNVDELASAHYINTDLYLPLSVLPELSGNNFYYHEIKGFTVIDKNKGNIGICVDVWEYLPQAILQIINPKGEILMPAVDSIIRTIDREHKIMEIEAPPHLIELYMG